MLLSSIDPPLTFTTDQCHTLSLDSPVTLYCIPAVAVAYTHDTGTHDTGTHDTSTHDTATHEPCTPFTATAHHLTLIKKAEDVSLLKDCHLVLSISLEQYQHILDHGLFHLKPEVRGPLHQADFWPDLPILLELGLQPYIFKDPTPDNFDEAPISPADHKRAIALLSNLLTLVEQTDPTKTSDDEPTPSAHPQIDPKTSGFIQDLLTELTPPQPSPYQGEGAADPVSPLTKGGLRGGHSPWQTTDGWLCRSVQQRQGDETVGYATLWAYATPEQTEPVFESGQTALEAIATLLQNTTDAIQSEIDQHLPQVKQSLSVFSDELITALEQVDWDTLLATDEGDQAEPSEEDGKWGDRPVSEVMKQFFDEDDWEYVVLEEEGSGGAGERGSRGAGEQEENPHRGTEDTESLRSQGANQISLKAPNHYPEPGDLTPHHPTTHPKSKIQNPKLLQLAFQGDSGRWSCLAQADDEAQQVVFYSLCPVAVPEDRCGAMAELILRVNEGLVIGNFEFDVDQGDIRYKTSLDTEGDRLTPALMERLVYANVQTMDTYLPSIMAVLSGECSPVEAMRILDFGF